MRIKIIGYGSLINKESLSRTIKNHSKFSKVWVHGYRRIFDLKSVKQIYEPWDKDVAVLNVEKRNGSKFNAIVYEISNEQFQKIISREKSYNMIKVKYSDYKTGKTKGEAFLFVGLEQFIHKRLNPKTHYFHICRKGAYSVSIGYGRDWDKTTFLANGKRISELGKHLIKLDKYHKLNNPYPEKI